jgi:hypothetical protein
MKTPKTPCSLCHKLRSRIVNLRVHRRGHRSIPVCQTCWEKAWATGGTLEDYDRSLSN